MLPLSKQVAQRFAELGFNARNARTPARLIHTSCRLQTDQLHRKRDSFLVEREASTDLGDDVGIGHGADVRGDALFKLPQLGL